jgi:hypothetical protein
MHEDRSCVKAGAAGSMAADMPFVEGREVLPALWLKAAVREGAGRHVVTPGRALAALR